MSLLGGLISGGASLLSGWMQDEAAEDRNNAQINWARENAAQSTALQREFAQNGVRWRVEDAKAAGLHPVFALGGSGATFTPSASSVSFEGRGEGLARGVAQAGQDISRAVMAQETPGERELRRAQLRLLNAQAGESDARAALAWNQAMRDYQSQQGGPGMPSSAVVPSKMADVTVTPIRHPLAIDHVELQADPQKSASSANRGITASHGKPSMSIFYTPSGVPFLLPEGNSMSEALEAVSESYAVMAWVLQENVRHFGADWFEKFTGMSWPREMAEAVRLARRAVAAGLEAPRRGSPSYRHSEPLLVAP